MAKPPKIVVTDIDEDPDIKRKAKIKEIKDWSALVVIVVLLWMMAATRMCFVFGTVMAFMTSIIATVQFIILIKSSFSRHIGNDLYQTGPQYQMPLNMYVRHFKEMLPCTSNKVADKRHKRNSEPIDTMKEHIPKMHRPL